MGNLARYWFKGHIALTKELEDFLIKSGLDENNYKIVEWGDERFLDHIFVEESNYPWKIDFEKGLIKFGIPFQKWMEG